MSEIIGGDKRSAYERWELPAMQADVSQGVQRRVPGPTAAAVEALQNQAHEEGFRAGREAGFKRGLEEGRAAARKEMAPRVELAHQLLEVLAKPLEALDAEVEQSLVSLSLAVARQLVRREIKLEPGQVVAVVREALAVLPASSRRVRLLLHPADAPLIREALSLDDAETHWQVAEDPALSRGGCRVETETSRVDATVEARLAAVTAQVLGGERGEDA